MPPRIRLDCLPGGEYEARPCEWSTCRHHLAGGQCVLDLVDANPSGMLREEIAELFGTSRQVIEQIEARALGKLLAHNRRLKGPHQDWTGE